MVYQENQRNDDFEANSKQYDTKKIQGNDLKASKRSHFIFMYGGKVQPIQSLLQPIFGKLRLVC